MLKLLTAAGCAWRALYLNHNEKQVAHIGVDPNHGVKPKLFGRVGDFSFRIGLPWMPFKHPAHPIYMRAYKLSSQFWHGVDGRYGWGTKKVP